ncbi:MAG: 4-hydroxythreonine-4-phosphate dehydrogenase PdxA, partial [Oxalobacteraceae bacterium]
PELCVRLAQRPRSDAHLIAYADPDTLHSAAKALSLSVRLLDPDQRAHAPGDLPLHPIRQAVPTRFGTADPANAAAVITGLRGAAGDCLSGKLQGIVTGPVHKAVINAGGIPYTGTTELLAEQAGCQVVMMLANAIVRVALVTTHLPLRAVADAITADTVARCLRITDPAMQRDFGLERPRIAVLGLNPHAGEDGHLGREELDIIIPVLEQLRGDGMQLVGPLPADTAFLPQKLTGFDAVVAMYHDQGLPVLKYSGFEQAVNITLGLPYPRVAVDHGTALELAGRGIADPSSLMAATDLCARLAARG